MRGMTDIIRLARVQHAVYGISEIQQSENVTRNWYRDEKKVNS